MTKGNKVDIYKLQRDILQASKLLDAIGKSSKIFCELELNTLADREVVKRAEAIHWSLLMYCNDVSAMLGQWRSELRLSLIFEEENSNNNQQKLPAGPEGTCEAHVG